MTTTITSTLLEGLQVAMLGTTDGDLISNETEIPAGEMYRLAAEYLTSITEGSPDALALISDAQDALNAPGDPYSELEGMIPALIHALHVAIMSNYALTH